MARPAYVLGVYRTKNVELLSRFMAAAEAKHVTWALWGLDGVSPALSSWTVGHGPGAKFDLLNTLVSDVEPHEDCHLVFVDDDVTFERGSLARLLELVERGCFDLAQPAHARRSHASFPFTRRRWWMRARVTTFVEIGPLFVCAAGRHRRFVPFASGTGMGWGLELSWWDAQQAGARLGIIDDVTVVHHAPVGQQYDIERHRLDNQIRLRERGLERMADMQMTLQTWARWRTDPPW